MPVPCNHALCSGDAIIQTGSPLIVFLDVAYGMLAQQLRRQLKRSPILVPVPQRSREEEEMLCVAPEDFWRVPPEN